MIFFLAVARLRLLAVAILAFALSANAREESLCTFCPRDLLSC